MIALVAWTLLSGNVVARDADVVVDMIELNHVMRSGELPLVQVIFWTFSREEGEFRVADYALALPGFKLPVSSPWVFYHRRGILRVFFKTTTETYSLYDPEVDDREFLPVEKRRNLLDGFRRRLGPKQVLQVNPDDPIAVRRAETRSVLVRTRKW